MSLEMEPLRTLGSARREARAGLVRHAGALWRDAPAWRLTAISTGVLILVASAMPLAMGGASQDGVRAVDALETAGVATPRGAGVPTPVAAAGASTPAASATDAATACPLRSFKGASGEGVVIGFLSPDAAASLLSQTEAQVGARINPGFLGNQRAVIGVGTPAAGRRVVALVPKGMTVARGERVLFAAGHRDATLPCAYVPNLISGRAAGN